MPTSPLPFRNRIVDAAIPAAIFALLGAMVIFAPLAFGSVQFWSQQVLFVLAVIISVALVVYITWGSQSRFIWLWCYLPIGLFVGLILLQMADLPAWLHWISPATATTKQNILQGVGEAVSARDTISFYTWPTHHQAYLIFILIAVFLATIHLCRSADAIKRMLSLMAVSGAIIAGVALYQNISGSRTFLGLAPMSSSSGPFVCHSHFGQFMNLSIGAMLALLLVKLAEVSTERITTQQVIRQLWQPRLRILWILFITIALSMATIFLSLTRGGVIAMAIALACTFGALHLANRGIKSSLPALLGLGVLVALLCFGFDLVYERLATLGDIESAPGGRMQIIADSMAAVAAFPLLGTGLGTFEYVFPMYDRSNVLSLAAHAENEYVQVLFETGVIGVMIVAAFFLLIARQARRSWRGNSAEPIHYAIYGLGYGIVAILIQSLSDFGQHLPGVAIMTAITFGLIVSIARMTHATDLKTYRPTDAPSSGPPVWRTAFAAIALIAIGIFATNGFAYFNNHRRAEAAWELAQRTVRVLEADSVAGTDEQYANLLESMMTAVELDPENVKYRHGLNLWRWRSITRAQDSETGDILIDDSTLEFAERIANDSRQVVSLCPTFGAAHSLAGQIQYFVLGEESGKQLITRGAELAGHDAEACFAAGIVKAEDGDKQSAQTWFERAVARNRGMRGDVVEFLANDLADPQLAYHFARADRRLLTRLAHLTRTDPDQIALAASWLQEARDQLIKSATSLDASASDMVELAEVYRKESNLDSAIDLYRRALAKDYGQVHRHYALAKLLADAGKVVEAKQQARVCLQIRPEMTPAKKLLAELARR